jgi:uncharacterized membrane protein YhaH (DUF805 family)
MKWYRKVWKQIADFKGRARRKEFWMFALMNYLIIIGYCVVVIIIMALFVLTELDQGELLFHQMFMMLVNLLIYYMLVCILPSLAVTVRRLHDTGRSGWNYLLVLIPIVGAIILFVYLVKDGTTGDNQYGPDPKAGERQIWAPPPSSLPTPPPAEKEPPAVPVNRTTEKEFKNEVAVKKSVEKKYKDMGREEGVEYINNMSADDMIDFLTAARNYNDSDLPWLCSRMAEKLVRANETGNKTVIEKALRRFGNEGMVMRYRSIAPLSSVAAEMLFNNIMLEYAQHPKERDLFA